LHKIARNFLYHTHITFPYFMQFDKIIAQEQVKYKLKELVQRNRLSHALLFLGKEGSGALPLAISFAQYILCQKVNSKSVSKNEASLFGEDDLVMQPVTLKDSCGECPSCVKINQLIHPDLHFSYPALKKDTHHDKVLSTDYITEWREFIQQTPYSNVTDWINFLKENSKSKIDNPVNKQGNITVFECDDISHKLSLKSFESNYKILIMWMPEYLGKEGNKLLKLIEEPPDNTLFIFVAEDENVILPTILSRTQLIKIPSLSNKELKEALIQGYDIDMGKASQIAGISEGNFREALQLLQNPEEDLQAQVREWLNIIVKNNVGSQLKWIDEISKIGREKQKLFLKYFIHLLEQAVRSNYLSEENLKIIPEKDLDFSARLNKICSLEAQEAMVKELEKGIYFIERNAHAKMLFHSLTIRFFHIIKDNSLILIN
jgi:DNA polymerase-3 subunit delta'